MNVTDSLYYTRWHWISFSINHSAHSAKLLKINYNLFFIHSICHELQDRNINIRLYFANDIFGTKKMFFPSLFVTGFDCYWRTRYFSHSRSGTFFMEQTEPRKQKSGQSKIDAALTFRKTWSPRIEIELYHSIIYFSLRYVFSSARSPRISPRKKVMWIELERRYYVR